MRIPRISRRQFLKYGVTGTGLVAAGQSLRGLAGADGLVRGGRSVSRTTGLSRRAVASTCLQCSARCGILGFVEEGELVKIEGNPRDPNTNGRICARGLAGINQLYDPDRLFFPVKRVGARGENNWRRISWDEALDEVAVWLKEVKEAGRPEELVFATGLEGADGVVRRFLSVFGSATIMEEASLYCSNKVAAQNQTWGASIETADAANSKYMLNFGGNPYECHYLYLGFAQRIVEGRMAGAKLVTFDPRLSYTAAKSDEWYPIRPGTDGLVALAMANVIFDQQLYDREFLEKWINYPVQKLAAHLAQYTPEAAARISWVPEDAIRRVATEFAMTRPGVAFSAGGVSKQLNGTQSERAVMLLNAITGNIDVRGGYCLPRQFTLREPDPKPPAMQVAGEAVRSNAFPITFAHAAQETLPAIKDKKVRASLLLSFMSNPVFANPTPQLSQEILVDEDMVPRSVAIATHLDETASLADIVLPAATYLESWGISTVPGLNLVPFVSLRQPIIQPRGESMSPDDILIELARRMGGGMEKFFSFGNTEAFCQEAVAELPDLAKMGGFQFLKANGLWYDGSAKPTYRSYAQKGFQTPSGKFEVYAESLEKQGLPALASFEELPVHGELPEDELLLLTYQINVQTYGNTANCKWLSEIAHDNPLLMHPETAKERNIKEGDSVSIASEAGKITARVRTTEGIHRQVVAIGGYGGRWAGSRVAMAERFESSRNPDAELLWWDGGGNGVHANRLIPVASDPVGRGQAWMGIRVKVGKA